MHWPVANAPMQTVSWIGSIISKQAYYQYLSMQLPPYIGRSILCTLIDVEFKYAYTFGSGPLLE